MAAGLENASKIIQIISIFSFICSSLAHSCGHTVPKPEEVVYGVPLGGRNNRYKRSPDQIPDQQLRIHLVYEGTISQLPAKEQNLIKNNLIPSAVTFWEQTLKVHRSSAEPIRLLPACNTNRVKYASDNHYPYCHDGCKDVTKCGETEVPIEHMAACREVNSAGELVEVGEDGAGVANTDFILYVSAQASERCDIGTTVAYAAYCELEGERDRPIAGYFNLCPKSISSLPHDTHQLQSTIKHEILHALGFSAGLYAFFRDPHGEPLTERRESDRKPVEFNKNLSVYQWSDRVVKKARRADWDGVYGTSSKIVSLMVTPNVVREVRAHFNCSTLEGAELEDQGVIGTALTHWEKRVFENEAMTGTYTQNPLISRITLAFMEDTGWYGVDYSKAENLLWGKNLGCDFVKKSCYEWISTRLEKGESPHPFCSTARTGKSLHSECPLNRDAVVVCNLVQYAWPLEQQYQHFSSLAGVNREDVPKYAGAVLLADFCPYLQELDWKRDDEVIRGSRCQVTQNNVEEDINYVRESYGPDSLCFTHASPWSITQCTTKHQTEHWGSGCYKYSCSKDEGLILHVNGESHRCFHKSQVLRIHTLGTEWLHEGNIICPGCDEICKPQGIACPADRSPETESFKHLQAPCSTASHSMGLLHILTVAIIIAYFLS